MKLELAMFRGHSLIAFPASLFYNGVRKGVFGVVKFEKNIVNFDGVIFTILGVKVQVSSSSLCYSCL